MDPASDTTRPSPAQSGVDPSPEPAEATPGAPAPALVVASDTAIGFQPSAWASPVQAPSPARPGGPSTVRTAILAAVLSSVLTVALTAVVLRAMIPAGATANASPAASASRGPGSSAGASAASTLVSAPLAAAPDAASDAVSATARVLPTVVTITTQSVGRRGATFSGAGSGFIVDSRGWILTNRHVVTGAATITVGLADGRTLPAQLYGLSSTNDLAIIRVDATGLPVAQLGDSLRLALGQSILVLGSPLGEYPGSVSSGVVSGLGRAIDITGVEHLSNLIQTDAAINPGNSGGPMVDLGGRVIGVAVATSQAAGIAFGIPIEDARSIVALALAGLPIP